MKTRAFSLVEITIALGIVAFALIALVSLAATMLDGTRKGKDHVVFAAIGQTVAGQLRALPWGLVEASESFPDLPLHFDDAGNPVGSGAAAFDVVVDNVPASADSSLPDNAVADALRRFRLEIRRSGTDDVLETFTFTVANHENESAPEP